MPMFIKFLIVAGGGALGATFRWLLSQWLERIMPHAFPWGIFACNMLGSFAIGILGGLIILRGELDTLWRFFLIIGLLGGFTTFSSFSFDTVRLLQSGEITTAFWNVGASVVCCLLATYIGIKLVT